MLEVLMQLYGPRYVNESKCLHLLNFSRHETLKYSCYFLHQMHRKTAIYNSDEELYESAESCTSVSPLIYRSRMATFTI
jgi:hypothetical protein